MVTKRLCMHIQKIPTKNTYDGFKANELDTYGDYKQPWKLDSGASGHYAGPTTGVQNRRKKRNGIKVLVADGNNMDQIEEGRAPFERLPNDALDVQIFWYMPNALISGGKLVKEGHRIILDKPIATVTNKLTNEIVMEAEFDLRLCT